MLGLLPGVTWNERIYIKEKAVWFFSWLPCILGDFCQNAASLTTSYFCPDHMVFNSPLCRELAGCFSPFGCKATPNGVPYPRSWIQTGLHPTLNFAEVSVDWECPTKTDSIMECCSRVFQFLIAKSLCGDHCIRNLLVGCYKAFHLVVPKQVDLAKLSSQM